MTNEKEKAIGEALKILNKKYGSNTVIKLDDSEIKIESLSTGSLALDNVFGCGGLPRGRIIELYGEESSGKSSLALFIAAQIQKGGGKVAWVDAEYAFDSDYAKKIGVKVEDLFVSQPENGEQALDVVDKMASTSAIDLIVLDSVAALVPEKELAGDIKDPEMAQMARMMSKGMRMLAGNISKTKTVVIFINQVRNKVGIYWGNKDVTPGGKALKFFSSVRLEVKKGKLIKSGEEAIGNIMYIRAVKNKVGMPWRTAQLNLYYERGIDLEAELFDLGVSSGEIKRDGNTFYFGDLKLGVGKENVLKFISDDKKTSTELKKKLRDIECFKKTEDYDSQNEEGEEEV